jgi:hypothetical protein
VLREQEIEEPEVRSVVHDLLARETGTRVELALSVDLEEPSYLAIDLEGGADDWTERLNTLAGEGWEVLSLQQLDSGTRAVLRRAA